MKLKNNLIAGLTGALALNILHESLKRLKATPRIDLLGEEALEKSLDYFDQEVPGETGLYMATLAADVASNALYYSAIGVGKKEGLWPRALSVGLAAGVGAVTLPKPMGLDPKPVADTPTKKASTVGYYVFGALVTAAVLEVMDSRK